MAHTTYSQRLYFGTITLLVFIFVNATNAVAQQACNGTERKGTHGNPVTLEPTRNLTKELCVRVQRQIIVTKWTCEFAKDGASQLCRGLGNGACDAIGWVWPESPRVSSDGNFNVYCITGHQDSDNEWRYFNIWLYNDDMP
jgi:hypothetical protein